MKHTNHINTISVSEITLDSLLEEIVRKAKKYNLMHKNHEPDAERIFSEIFGMTDTLHVLAIGNIIELDDELEYITEVRIWCGKYDKTQKVN